MFTPSKRSSKGKELAMKFLWLIILVPLALAMALGISGMAMLIPEESLPQLLTTIILSVQAMIVFFGSAQYISMLFFSKDTEMLMAMPIKPQTIFLSKFLTIYASYIVVSLIMQLPSTIALGVVSGAGAVYYLLGVLAVFLTPAIPLLAISLIAIPLSYVAGYFKRNNTLGTIFATIAFTGFFGVYMYFVMSLSSGSGEAGFDIVAMTNILDIMSKIVYPNLFLTRAMLGSGIDIIINLAIYFSIIIVALGITYALSAVMYKNLATRFLEVGVSKNAKVKQNFKTSRVVALVKRDVKGVLSESAMAFNFIVGIIMTPLFLVIFNMTSMGGGEDQFATQMSLTMTALISMFMISSTNYWAMLSISREGKNISLLKMLPITGREVLGSKNLISDMYVLVITIICGIIQVSFGMNWLNAILYVVSSILVNVGIGSFLIERDLKSPKLHWNNLKEILRNNMSSLFGMLLTLPASILGGVGLFLSFVVAGEGGTPNEYVLGAMTFVPMIIIGIIYLVCFRLIRRDKVVYMYDTLE